MEDAILKEINRLMPHGSITIDDIYAMKLVEKAVSSTGYDIFAIQHRDLTILVQIDACKNKFKIKIIMW